MRDLVHFIRNCPLIDNHAHNILLPEELDTFPFETITTEAQGQALADTFKSLPHIRAVRQLRELYDCDENANWEEILRKRADWLEARSEELTRRCFEGTHSILMDDGLGGIEGHKKVHPYYWHDQFTQGPTKRIVRIETVAESVMEKLLDGLKGEAHQEKTGFPQRFRTDNTGRGFVSIYLTAEAQDVNTGHEAYQRAYHSFTTEFAQHIHDAINDPHVAGFKSVVCYRTGLDVFYNGTIGGEAFRSYATQCIETGDYKIGEKPLNDGLVHVTLELLKKAGSDATKPIQFHTGLGDADINLLRSNPAYLQPLIEQFPTVPFVLLHSSYPYTREAGYLATVFKNVYLDIGEVFPMLSRDGQVSVLRQSIELVPASKLLWSTDGHLFPETYWLANKQFREVLEEVLPGMVRKRDLTTSQAIEFIKDILFNNSNRLYGLELQLNLGEEPTPSLRTQVKRGVSSSEVYDVQVFEKFDRHHPVKFVYVQWLDYMGTLRGRVLPIAEFRRIITKGSRIGISLGNIGTLQNDTVTAASNTTGQIYIEPDLSTLRRTHSKDPISSASVLGFWRSESGQPLTKDPRFGLQHLLSNLSTYHGISLLIGFEIEVTFLRRTSIPSDPYAPLTTNHAWGSMTPEDTFTALPLLAEITAELDAIGVPVQQFHSEAGAGQYEFVLPPLPALQAVDALVQARQVVHQIAATHDLRATLHPMPIRGIGTAAHAHISLNALGGADPGPSQEAEMNFFAGVMKHLEAVCAFTLPEAVSYDRVIDDSWTGGTWVAWGTQNRETPLRRVEKGRWEVRCLDGMANMYLALAVVVGAGLIGLRTGMKMEIKDCPYNPSKMDDRQRREYGIERRLPEAIDTALHALEQDQELKDVLAEGLVEHYIIMKKEEQKILMSMPQHERRIWLIERY